MSELARKVEAHRALMEETACSECGAWDYEKPDLRSRIKMAVAVGRHDIQQKRVSHGTVEAIIAALIGDAPGS